MAKYAKTIAVTPALRRALAEYVLSRSGCVSDTRNVLGLAGSAERARGLRAMLSTGGAFRHMGGRDVQARVEAALSALEQE